MDPKIYRCVKRIIDEMMKISAGKLDKSIYIGLGLALAFIYEEYTDRNLRNKHMKDIIQWAIQLEEPTKKASLTLISEH